MRRFPWFNATSARQDFRQALPQLDAVAFRYALVDLGDDFQETVYVDCRLAGCATITACLGLPRNKRQACEETPLVVGSLHSHVQLLKQEALADLRSQLVALKRTLERL